MLIYAHRGASKDHPEHTKAAYLAAVAQGADGFECDVRLTKDGVPVLWHDADEVASTNFSDLARINPEVMTLDEFLDIAITHKKGVAIETKHPVPTGNAVEDAVIDALKKHRAAEKIDICIMSFSLLAVSYLKRKSNFKVVQLVGDEHFWIKPRIATPHIFAPSINKIREHPDFVEKMHKKGKTVNVWTVDDPEDQRLCERIGVDIMITNTPGQARNTLG